MCACSLCMVPAWEPRGECSFSSSESLLTGSRVLCLSMSLRHTQALHQLSPDLHSNPLLSLGQGPWIEQLQNSHFRKYEITKYYIQKNLKCMQLLGLDHTFYKSSQRNTQALQTIPNTGELVCKLTEIHTDWPCGRPADSKDGCGVTCSSNWSMCPGRGAWEAVNPSKGKARGTHTQSWRIPICWPIQKYAAQFKLSLLIWKR